MTLLEALGVPVDVLITLDLESFYSPDYGLKKLGTEAYVRDPRFELLGVGIAIGDGPSIWLDADRFQEWASYVDWSRVALLAHNTAFDAFVFAHHFGIKAGFYLDTLSMGRAIHGIEVGGSLDALTKYYGVGVKGKEVHEALGKHRADFTPEEWAAYIEYCCNDTDLARRIFWKMVDGFPEVELWHIDTTLRCFVEPVLQLDRDLATEAVTAEQEKKAALLDRVAADRSVLMSNEQFAALLLEMGEDPPMKLSAKKTATAREKDPDADEIWVPAFAKSDPGFKELLDHPKDEIRWLAEARVGVKSTGQETRAQKFLAIDSRGPMPVFLRHHGAHTGRDSAGDGSNFQNLERIDPKRKAETGRLRRALLAPPGHELAVVDSAQVEARVIAWLAGHDRLLDIFRREGDIYSEEGTRFFGKPISKEHTPTERQVSKNMVLGLNFGMGWEKFAAELLKGMLGSAPQQFTMTDAGVMGVDVARFAASPKNMKRVKRIISRLELRDLAIHCAVTAELVRIFRDENEPITNLWGEMDAVIAAMYSGEKYRFGPGESFRTIKNGIVLPAGRTLRYPDLECDDSSWSYRGGRGTGPKSRRGLYGGKLTENVVQAVARDVVFEQILWGRAEGVRVVTKTHDEGVFLASNEDIENWVPLKLWACFTRAPEWALGLPLSAEGGFNRSYGKAK